ncbi:hypothetical protein COU19_02450 [Candidatus Kaiserbacteria bacterium CG10_big_fil_rev_8_21_14_0_10_56_12]|uniref:Uncharacterized protein n=1 Tax=Candidatus Kaiserbacteria bacterium CG10_big_fil_rev_8_21_14_0_10_56_12 TaxID=1974611 RepID=A0A2H0U9A9_9BACT|nr:MAG: hypothetical protein COU19_02450 [Candidatus Kaiserbacteria bacterium CG10_big_fil_rev_8_21_14_0_10_56_12]
MLYGGNREIEDRVLELLVDDRQTIKALCAKISIEHKVSLRGVYKAVNKLVAAGVLLKVGKKVLLSDEWATRVSTALGAVSAPVLSTGERLTYTFTSLEHLDEYWKSTVLPLQRALHPREVFFYNPHCFWSLLPARRESEEAYYRHFGPEEQGFLVVSGTSPADEGFRRAYQSEFFQIELRGLTSFRKTDHVTVLGSHIVTTRLSSTLAAGIAALYDSGRGVGDFPPELLALCARPGKVKFVLENNPSKADTLRKALARNFYFRRAT